MVVSLRPISANLKVLVRELKVKSLYMLDLSHGQTEEHGLEQSHYPHSNCHMRLARYRARASSVVRPFHNVLCLYCNYLRAHTTTDPQLSTANRQ
jgi:hypothetical protein